MACMLPQIICTLIAKDKVDEQHIEEKAQTAILFIGQGHYGKVKGQIKVRPRCCTSTTP